MLNRRLLVSLFLASIAFSSAVSFGESNKVFWTDVKIFTGLQNLKGNNGVQGCIIEDSFIFWGAGALYKYSGTELGPRKVFEASYIGPVYCEKDGAYFVAGSNKLDLFRYSNQSVQLLIKEIDCVTVVRSKDGSFVCFRDASFDGAYVVGTYDLEGRLFQEKISTRKIGLSEGEFIALGDDSLLGVFLGGDAKKYLVMLDTVKWEVKGSAKLNCGNFASILKDNEQFYYLCDGESGVFEVASFPEEIKGRRSN